LDHGGSGSMTIGLAMIVRNEASTLPRLAASLRGQINYWTIVDTGSTDNTMEVAREVFDGVPGQILQEEWRGFGPARNVAHQAAVPHTDWVLWIDADESLGGTLDTSHPGNCIEAQQHFGNLRYWLPRLTRDPGWEWKGRCHEYLSCPIPLRVQSERFWFIHHADGGSRGNKYWRDLALLQADWDDEPNARTAFYLARTYQDGGQYRKAVDWYRLRLTMRGWNEETFLTQYCLGKCLLALDAYDEGCGALWASWGLKPHRAEPLVALSEHYRRHEQWSLAWHAAQLACECRPQPDDLFVDTDATKWKAAYEGSISAWYVGERERGRSLIDYLCGQDDLPLDIRDSVAYNRSFYEGGTS
jgi:glycosyltransferase involved in cell wall biosynthesis